MDNDGSAHRVTSVAETRASAATAPWRPRRWVGREIARLDPEVDYERIVSLIGNYELNGFIMNLNCASGFMSTTVPPGGPDVMIAMVKAVSKPQTRYLDTVEFFWLRFFDWTLAPGVQVSSKRLDRLHARMHEQHPGSFKDNDDWIFIVVNLGCTADRMRDRVGAPRQPKNVQIAWHHFWRDIAVRTISLTGSLHGLGRTRVLAFVPPAVRKRHGLQRPNRLGRPPPGQRLDRDEISTARRSTVPVDGRIENDPR